MPSIFRLLSFQQNLNVQSISFGLLLMKDFLWGFDINITYSCQLSTAYLFGIISPRLTWEQIENCLYIYGIDQTWQSLLLL